MLDTFEILTTSGVVLWSRSYMPVSPSVINSFINDVFIEESGASAGKDDQPDASYPPYKADQHTLKWTIVKELGIIFVAVYRSLLHLSWIDRLVENLKTIFVDLYGDQLKKPNTTLVHCHTFDDYFDQQVQELETTGREKSTSTAMAMSLANRTEADSSGDEAPPPPSAESTPVATPSVSRPSTPASHHHLLISKGGPMGKVSRRARKTQNSPALGASGDEGPSRKGKKVPKKGRKWDVNGFADEEDDVQLDYSTAEASGCATALEGVKSSTWGTTTSKGQFVLKDLGDEVHSILAAAQSKNQAVQTSGGLVNSVTGLFRNVIGGKTLTEGDLDKAMKGMETHLLNKNVALEAAKRLCAGVEQELIGVKMATFESINSRIAKAMEASLTKMLTPTSSLDLLRQIDAIARPSGLPTRPPRPYVLSIVGVNGVGKSTNLSKICFFLLQNKYKVLIAAGDTFRSGAVEQLKVHVKNLKEMTEREGGKVDIFEKGYGGDAASVAKDAVREAATQGYDVVLIDTAGRRHNDQRLMSSLEKFAKYAEPDKILMVGEALVGTDSVAQARNFNSSFGPGRKLDGFIISKCDTVGNMVGAIVSLVHATNVPVLFVGVGQHYTDIRNFSVRWAVERLLSNV